MEWTGPKQGKLRKALIEIHGVRGISSLELFITDNFECSLDGIPKGNKEDWAAALIKQFVADGELIKGLYQLLCQKHERHPVIQSLQQDLGGGFSLLYDMPESFVDVSIVFDKLSPSHDFKTVHAAFLRAFSLTYDRPFQETESSPLEKLQQIQEFLEADRPLLAVRFTEQLIIRLKAANSRYDISGIEKWCAQIAQINGISVEPKALHESEVQGYLLVSLEKNKVSQHASHFTIYSELFVTGQQQPVEFDSDTVTGSVDDISQHLSTEIIKAENVLSAYGTGQVTIEFFLPYDCLELDVASWDAFDKRKKKLPYPLGKHRPFIVRSFDRAEENRKKAEINRKWSLLEKSLAHKQECEHFHTQTEPPDPGDLQIDLSDKAGLKLIAELPRDRRNYQAILDSIIDSAVPVALWFSSAEGIDADNRLAEFNRLLYQCECLTDFSLLAKQWRKWRKDSPFTAGVPHLHILCDCPDRWPLKPFDKMPLIPS